jgi:acyl transferase domain-containing protein/phosphopantetheinyl transferase (holo-ACP synthase)
MAQKEQDIAVIGMACLYAGAPNMETFWGNIVSKVDAVTDPPASWRVEEIFDPKTTANDRIYCKRGGFVAEFAEFNPTEFGIMPNSVDGADPAQFLALKVARDALVDAGYEKKDFNRAQTAVILGHGNCVPGSTVNIVLHSVVIGQLIDVLKKLHPHISEPELTAIKRELKANLPPLTADNCPGVIPNILTSRIANRLDLQGPAYTVDAACTSSLVALDAGINELRNRRSYMAIVGGVHTSTNVPLAVIFSLVGALSRRGRILPFDRRADGTILGEGIGMMVIKRLVDAERDGDRIYATVKGVGMASDGRGQAMLTPRMEGELLALRRAYETTGIDPDSIEMIEAHGTATRVGDATEIEALSRLFGSNNGIRPHCAIGTVKSMIGHPILASGMAGLIKTALSLYHKVLPPTLCSEPNPDLKLDGSPFYLNTETRPWIHYRQTPRRAGVNAFGFGGINAHVILEQYNDGDNAATTGRLLQPRTSEVIILRAETRQGLLGAGKSVLGVISEGLQANLVDVAYTLNRPLKNTDRYRLSIVAGSLEDLGKKLASALSRLCDSRCEEITDLDGVFFFDHPLAREGKMAFLFAGEGAQYSNMLSDLCIHFPEARRVFEHVDRLFAENNRKPLLSEIVFPTPCNLPGLDTEFQQKIWSMEYAVMAVYAADMALYAVLKQLEIRPDAIVGHSIGQDIALSASGAIKNEGKDSFEDLWFQYFLKTRVLGPSIEARIPKVKLMAVGASDRATIASVVDKGNDKLYVSMDNCPNQIIICGLEDAISRAHDRLTKEGAICSLLPFHRPYHTPWYRPACEAFMAEKIGGMRISLPDTKVYHCGLAKPYPNDVNAIRKIMVEQWVQPVRFRDTIEAMYRDGVRIFVQVGPSSNLTSFVEDTLGARSHAAVPLDVRSLSSLDQLNRAVAVLAAHGASMSFDYLYQRRRGLDRVPIPKLSALDRSISTEKTRKQGTKSKGMKLKMDLPRLTIEKAIPLPSLTRNVLPEKPATKDREIACSESGKDPVFGSTAGAPCHGKGAPGSFCGSMRPGSMKAYLRNTEKVLGRYEEVLTAVLEPTFDANYARRAVEKKFLRARWAFPALMPSHAGDLLACLCVEREGDFQAVIPARSFLNDEELELWKSLPGTDRKKQRWLRGRIAAKDAVCLFSQKRFQADVQVKDVVIRPDSRGKPAVSWRGTLRANKNVLVSIAHSDNVSVAIVGEDARGLRGLGIDIERVDANHAGLEEGGFLNQELVGLVDMSEPERSTWLLRLWCAKEAVAKALGYGMQGDPLGYMIHGFDPVTGVIDLKITGRVLAAFPDLTGDMLTSYTGRDGDLVFATAFL